MKSLEVSGAVRHIYASLGFKGLIKTVNLSGEINWVRRYFKKFKRLPSKPYWLS